MKRILLLIFFTANLTFSYSQNKNWEEKDKELISSVVESLKDSQTVHKLFDDDKESREKTNLGFGYTQKSDVLYGGYISIWCDFLFYKDSLVSYILKPELPRPTTEKQLTKYLEWYDNQFEITQDTLLKPKYYNYDIFKKPLKYYKGDLVSDAEIKFYMSTESGLIDGERGGESMSVVGNRKHYLNIKNKLNKEITILLMYSKNPISRLRAVEFYYENPEIFIDKKEELEKWISFLKVSPPVVRNIYGCLIDYQTSESIIEKLSKKE
jgi:hypothetical protein